MSVLEGPRREIRRVLLNGGAQWCTPDGDSLVLGDGRRIEEATATYLPPVTAPSKVLCVHLNYVSRATEFGNDLEGKTPTYFTKPPSSLSGHRGELVRPGGTQWLNYEGEIAAVVGRPMRNVATDDVWEHLAGFAPSNDVGCHDFRDTDSGSMLRVKGMDTFCPIGPGLVSGVDVRQSTLRTYINGNVVQEGKVSEMVWGIDYLLADLCRYITLEAGDIILTGTPWRSRPMADGDVVEVEIDGLGKITNTVVRGEEPAHGVGHRPTNSKQVRAVALGKDYHRMKADGLDLDFDDYLAVRDSYREIGNTEGPARAV
ncbi:MAG: FAA hydrolase family protein [Actinomycetia bacterium]|nr:FAA hydrolase family protein [Actinomycetes bacterium]